MRILALVLAVGLGTACSKPAEQPAPAATAPPAHAVAKAPAGGPLTRTDCTKVALADELTKHAETVVVFYRGFY